MEIVEFALIKDILAEMLKGKKLVPVIGAGFTRNETTAKGKKVPDGNELTKLIINEIIKNPEYTDLASELHKKNFNQVSTYFFNDSVVQESQRREFLKEYFLDIQLPTVKKNILDISVWPYIYTLNIDNAIERNSEFRKILPYKSIHENTRDAGCVYKVHGDVEHEVFYQEDTNLIFSEPQYVRSLLKNESMLTFLKTDLRDNNLIFIGCSLENEIDLMFAFLGEDTKYNEGAKRILVTRRTPSNKLQELDYEKYGINVILKIDDYADFYKSFNDLIKNINFEQNILTKLAAYEITEISELKYDKDANLTYLLQNTNKIKQENCLIKPAYLIERNIANDILKSANTNPITIVKGRRFSGKSSLVSNIFEKNKSKKLYYFPSSIKIDESIINELNELSNALIIFDSNTLDQELALSIKRNCTLFQSNKNSIIILCNNMEIDIANTFLMLSYDNFYFDISNRLNSIETNLINSKLSPLGIIKFKENKTILDNVYYMRKTYPDKAIQLLDNYDIKDIEAQLLIILSIFDKVYIPVCVALGMNTQEWYAFIEKFSPIVDLEETNYIEREQHSRFKITVNSKIWLNKILKDYHWSVSERKILDNIKRIVQVFINHGQYQLIQRRVMLFDSLNEIMGKEGGSFKLMRFIYEGLHKDLGDLPDYWLQRAKVIYKLEKYDTRSVKDAIDFARKAQDDGERQRTISNAEFYEALLYGKLCSMEKYTNYENIIEAIKCFYKAIKNHEYNKDYVNSMLENSKSKKGVFSSFCGYLSNGEKTSQLLHYKFEINEILKYASS